MSQRDAEQRAGQAGADDVHGWVRNDSHSRCRQVRSGRLAQGLGEQLAETKNIGMSVVQRNRCNADCIGLAPVTDRAELCEPIQDAPAAAIPAGDPERELAAACGRLAWSDESDIGAE